MFFFIRFVFLVVLLALRSAAGQIAGASQVLLNAGGQNAAYSGIGRFMANSTCTAFLIRAAANPAEETPAYVLTNGHCLPDRSANAVVVNQELRNASVIFNYFRDTQDRQVRVPVVGAAYSAMKGTDIAVVQLEGSYNQILNRGVVPLELASEAAVQDEEVTSVGAPAVDIPQEDAFLRQASCVLGSPRNLIEFIWHFRDGLPNSCPDIKGGSSGSPIISKRTGAVVAIMNTTTAGAVTHSGDFPCFLNQPCEVVDGAVRYQTDTNYALALHFLKSCFDERGYFQLEQSGCALDPGRQLQLSAPARASQPAVESETGELVRPRWNVELRGDAYQYYRYKTVREASGGDCRDLQRYGDVVTLSERPVIDDDIPAELGRYYLCVLGGNTPVFDASWQAPQFASMVHTRIDDTKPTIPITYQLRDEEQAYVMTPYFVLPELVWFEYQLDIESESTCQRDEGYRVYNRVPVRIAKDTGVRRVCLFGEDEAGNRTEILQIQVYGTSIRPEGVTNAASLMPVPLARRSIMTILGVNLAAAEATAPPSGPVPNLGNVTIELRDSAGRQTSLPLFYVGRGQVNALIPEDAAIGPAQLSVSGPNGPATATVGIEDGHPGLFTASGGGFGPPAGLAIRTSSGGEQQEPLYQCGAVASCVPRAVDLPKQGETLTLALPATGLHGIAPGDLDLRLGSLRVAVTSLEDAPASGVQTIHARLGPEFPLRGYLPLTVTAAGHVSNRLFVLLR